MQVDAEIVGVVKTLDLRTGTIRHELQVQLGIEGTKPVGVEVPASLVQEILGEQPQASAAPVSFGGDDGGHRPAPAEQVRVTGDHQPIAPPVARRSAPAVTMDAAGNPIPQSVGGGYEADEEYGVDEDGVAAG